MVYPRGTGAEAHLGCHPNASLKACSSTVGGYSNYGTAIASKYPSTPAPALHRPNQEQGTPAGALNWVDIKFWKHG